MIKFLESIWMKFLLINPIIEYALLIFSWIWSWKVKCESYRIPRSLIWSTFCILLTESVLLMWYAVSMLSLEVYEHDKSGKQYMLIYLRTYNPVEIPRLHIPQISFPNNSDIDNTIPDYLKVYSDELFFISTNERLMYKFYKTYNYFIFK